MLPVFPARPVPEPLYALRPTALRGFLQLAMASAARNLLDVTPETFLPRPEWADADGHWLMELAGARSGRARTYLDHLAVKRGDIECVRLWECCKLLRQDLDEKHPEPPPPAVQR